MRSISALSNIRRNVVRQSTIVTRNSSTASETAAAEAATVATPTSKIVGIAFFSSVCAYAVGLGVWQAKRYHWKVGVIEDIKLKLNDPPEIIPSLAQFDLVEWVDQMQGRRVAVTGIFDHSKEILIGPRSAPLGLMGDAAQGLAVNPQGYYVITPFNRSDGTVVFINRGWVAMKETNWLRPLGVTTLSTVVSHPEKKNTFTPVNDPASMKLLWVEAGALRICADLPALKDNEMIVLEAFEKDEVPVTSYPAAKRQKHLDQQNVSPLTHLVYAFTWFTMAAAGVVMTYYKFRTPRGKIIRNAAASARAASAAARNK